MDTKLRKASHSYFVKLLLFTIVIISFSISLQLVFEIGYGDFFDLDTINESEFLESRDFAHSINVVAAEFINESFKINKKVDEKVLKNVEYYYKNGNIELISTKGNNLDHIKNLPAYVIMQGTEIETYPFVSYQNYFYYIENVFHDITNTGGVLYLGFTDDYIQEYQIKWQEKKDFTYDYLVKIGIGFLILGISFILLLLLSGRRFWGDKEVETIFLDKMYTEINLVICGLLIATWVSLVMQLGPNYIEKFLLPVTIVIGTAGLIFVLSLVRNIKSRTLIKNFLIYKILHKIFKFIEKIYNSGTTGRKVTGIVIAYPLIAALSLILFPVTIGVAVWLSLREVEKFNAIKLGLEKVKAGDLHHEIQVQGKGELARLAQDINSVTEGLNNAVRNELKSERMKAELITNVSHDIKTPLTSIITYTDLLKTEKNPEKIQEYLEILSQKSQRLKSLTEDLFEASKASSGNIPVNFEKVDLVALINQGLGECSEKIEENGLEFKFDYHPEKIEVNADGKLLWRAIENLLSNIFKYALKGSRIYINAEIADKKARIIIKNISAFELNISPDELMERFTRGDESRSSDGSGLGLSIAKSLIEIQRGNFKIEIDGDLFKTYIELECWE
ncbi:MAG: HAMP domain-containing sensor histidine kinase [Eubacteriales bacterium]|nr:HAMP domain-containing sensor histidine kinase [Eubacteriales bacterium]